MIRGRLISVALALGLGSAGAPVAAAPSEADLERMSGMALLLGRAVGCDLDTDWATGVIGAWLDQTFQPGSLEQRRYLQVFAENVRRHARQQHNGDTPDSCADVAEALRTMRW